MRFLHYSSLVPGFAFANSLPYIELRELDFQNRWSNQTQRQFYQVNIYESFNDCIIYFCKLGTNLVLCLLQEAGIKRAVFMGCRSGEIELGLSNVVQLNMEIEMTRFFPEDFPR
ncbi:hypothetical protein Goarm_004709 [Gossypium armourianum]|uniref:DUF7050 domain-containing protein n=1 Tax=Gossypium armourianum TaxID=34283 RepID=A0A7J9JXM2_9ROSI|nr:hypothetical protein [Gossypium armourianum]